MEDTDEGRSASDIGVRVNGELSPLRVPPVKRQSGSVTVPSKRREVPVRRLFVWLLFSVIFGLFPIIAAGFKGLTASKGFSVDEMLASGELFVVSAVLSAGALGELISAGIKGSHPGYLRIAAGFFCLLCFCANTMGFMDVGGTPPQLNTTLSITFFIVTTVVSAVCIGVSGDQ